MTAILYTIGKNNTCQKIAIFLALLLFNTGCDSFVEVSQPSGQLTTETVFQDRATAEAAVTAVYSSMRDTGILSGSNISITTKMGAYADELNFYGTSSNTTLNFYNNTLLPSNPQVNNWWKAAYSQIYATNSLIEGISNSKQLSQADKDQFTGESLFIRSLIHFYLMNLYGDVPYITSTDYVSNNRAVRRPAEFLYSKIIEDLLVSYSLLQEKYLTTERTRPNKAVAMALLARVYLYSQHWAEASNAASYIINKNDIYKWESDLNKIFLKGSTTTIWQYKPALEGQNTAEGGAMILLAGPPSDVALNPMFVDSFETGDLRKQKWIGSVSKGSLSWSFAYKYKTKLMTSASVEYSIQFRLAEQYLIRAEARAYQGDLIGAKEDLNKIRRNAGLNDTNALSQQEIIAAVKTERRYEMFTESGHRFFDLKRNGDLDAVLTGVKFGWNSTDRLLPIPESELILNPNLQPQNPGY
ncbi:RagB/SusD family nutrient uptake outer membrane protein [Flavobacterium johnsoniae]|uniref:RagB/SusD family nutrient uptake outer membrane protein n=1 Tax=Flavobacterium johnsoniae TaxID=986 RepID=UPI0025AFA3FD|nr:RagB/SusD family nutrient uptake outer membrane protein [Flavobacterium johnsoniae]WJS93381.1 RagB/SusD family nutrient uptake outer membrane protein [Flavobacterium johnsoniae]